MPEMTAHLILPDADIAFEKIGHAHCHVLEALHGTSFENPWTAQEFAQLLTHGGTGGLMSLNAQHIPLGFVLIRSVLDEAEILTFCVEPQHRGRKIARRMLESARTMYKARGINRIFLEVAEDNLPARELYQGCGFTMVGQRPGYYCESGKPAAAAIIMTCSW